MTGTHLAFYRFVRIDDVAAVCDRLRELTDGMLGTVLVAAEGVNGMLAAPDERVARFVDEAAADPLAGVVFDGITYKQTVYERVPFSRLMIKAKQEIVPLGVDGLDMPSRVDDVAATDVPPAQWRELIDRDDVVVIDNRNSFEYEVGRFRGAVDPGVVNFRDFREFVTQHAPQWRAEGKQVAMYCTGGIRCEKSSPWMQDLGLQVHQLQGGILNYFAQVPDADADFEGECFVFDNRVTLDTQLRDVGRDRSEVDG
ncbi:oxygen-dependent tRNA uridine(34) hydroxylase TrhO [Calidifontibacter terrae]